MEIEVRGEGFGEKPLRVTWMLPGRGSLRKIREGGEAEKTRGDGGGRPISSCGGASGRELSDRPNGSARKILGKIEGRRKYCSWGKSARERLLILAEVVRSPEGS